MSGALEILEQAQSRLIDLGKRDSFENASLANARERNELLLALVQGQQVVTEQLHMLNRNLGRLLVGDLPEDGEQETEEQETQEGPSEAQEGHSGPEVVPVPRSEAPEALTAQERAPRSKARR